MADQIKALLSRSPDRTRLPGDRANSRWIAVLGKDPFGCPNNANRAPNNANRSHPTAERGGATTSSGLRSAGIQNRAAMMLAASIKAAPRT